jgi:uncharacterized membrane protein
MAYRHWVPKGDQMDHPRHRCQKIVGTLFRFDKWIAAMSNPILNIATRPVDWLLESLALLGIGVNTGLAFGSYSSLPLTVPIHFNATGEADIYDDKSTLLLLSVAAIVIFLILTFLIRVPRMFRYPVRVTQHNAQRQYENAALMLRLMNITIAWTFAYVTYGTIGISLETMDGLGPWFLPTVVLVMLVISALMVYRSYLRQ